MLPFRKILFPVDYSAPCRATVPYVQDMARHFSAYLTLVHAYSLRPAFVNRDLEGVMVYNDLATDPAVLEEARRFEGERLRKFATEMFPDQRVESIADEGEPGSLIHRVLQHQGADLVMMPTRGDGPLRRFLLGSVAAKVLHDVSAAVWTGVGSALEHHQPGIPYKSIVCALDESEEAEVVLRGAAALAKSYNAALALVHVLEMPPGTPEMDFSMYRKELIEGAHARMRELKGRLSVDAPDTVVDVGISEGIREEIVRRKADLLVVGRGHDQGAISRIWSRLYAIVRDSPCPVLSV
ncbi:MAG TPA: universal stress protein [Bryobacteraceae bacterium]|nr:universal stress protein [Bryobacteraceae bacterium]